MIYVNSFIIFITSKIKKKKKTMGCYTHEFISNCDRCFKKIYCKDTLIIKYELNSHK